MDIDRFVVGHAHGYAYQRPAWCMAVQQAYGGKAWVLMAKDSDSRISSVMQLSVHRGLSMRQSLHSLPYCDFGGAVGGDEQLRAEFVDFAKGKARELRIGKLDINELGGEAESVKQGEKVSVQMPLPDTFDELWRGFKAKLRSQVRKAEKNGLTFEFGSDSVALRRFYGVYSRNMRDLGSPPHSYRWFRALQDSFADDMLVGVVLQGDRCVGAGLILAAGQNVSIPWASTLREANRLAPNMLLYCELLRVAIERGATVFDFGRSEIDAGTFKFKRQWGGRARELRWRKYDCATGALLHSAASASLSGRQAIEKVWRRLPVPLATCVGSRMRRFISL